ncbi:phage minor tail protein [Escherichia coli]|nr:phage minor tail protein [Escherichia coli]
MLANTCTWTYRGDECGYHGPAVADEYDQPTSDITKDKCSKCLSGCKFRNNVGNGKGTSTRPTLTVSNLYGMVTGMAEDLQSLVGGTVLRRKVYARFLDAVNFVNGNSDADPEQEVISRWRIEQCSELSAVSASFVLSTPTETDGAVFPGRIMLANTCTWTYRGDECGYHGPAVADEYDQPTSDITKDKCSKCLSGCKFRNNVGNFGGFLSINKLSQ